MLVYFVLPFNFFIILFVIVCINRKLATLSFIYYALFMKNTLLNIWKFYIEGFRSMTLGRTLWLIILVKLFIMFFILKMFFFPNFLGDFSSEKDKSDYVGNELIRRATPPD